MNASTASQQTRRLGCRHMRERKRLPLDPHDRSPMRRALPSGFKFCCDIFLVRGIFGGGARRGSIFMFAPDDPIFTPRSSRAMASILRILSSPGLPCRATRKICPRTSPRAQRKLHARPDVGDLPFEYIWVTLALPSRLPRAAQPQEGCRLATQLLLLRTEFYRAPAIALLLSLRSVYGQTAAATPVLSGIAHAAIRVSDLARSREFYVGLGIEMQNPAEAQTFYEDRLGFQRAQRPWEVGSNALDIPGKSGEQIEFVPRSTDPAFRLLFSVPDLSRAAAQLKALQISAVKQKSELSIQDPDGNTLVFVEVKL